MFQTIVNSGKIKIDTNCTNLNFVIVRKCINFDVCKKL